jgi:hypothetical protein
MSLFADYLCWGWVKELISAGHHEIPRRLAMLKRASAGQRLSIEKSADPAMQADSNPLLLILW